MIFFSINNYKLRYILNKTIASARICVYCLNLVVALQFLICIFVFFFCTLFLCLIFQSTFCIFSIILKSCFLYYFLFVFILFLVITITVITIVCASFLFSISSLSFLTFSSYCQNYRLNDEVSCDVVINHQKKTN